MDPARGDRGHGSTADRVPEVQVTVLEPAVSERTAVEAGRQVEAGQEVGLSRRDDHRRVTCNHCGARVLTRISGAMWGHTAGSVECPGSRTWSTE